MECTIEGSLERVVFVNEESNYTVAKLKVKGRQDLITIVGNLAGINPGEILRVSGEWINHKRFGDQFKVTSYLSLLPSTVRGIEKYLSSGLIKGIGPVMAKRIVKKFGEDTLRIIEEESKRLDEVEGIGRKRTEVIKDAWQEQKEVRDVMIFLQSQGISSAYASKIYKQYGDNTISVLKNNPYRLASDVYGIGFKTADKIAARMGIESSAPIRVEAGILYTLSSLSEQGHVYCPYDELVEEAGKILGVEKDYVINAFPKLSEKRDIIIENILGKEENGKAVYLASFYVSEKNTAEILKAIQNTPFNINTKGVDPVRALQWIENRLTIQLNSDQKYAVIKAFSEKIMVITGGPGTGKTTLVKAIIEIFKALKAEVLLAAPTGRAAKRLSEVANQEAKTIHRLLEFSFKKGGFQRNKENPLKGDVIIVDEASMIDCILIYQLIKAIPFYSKLILVGDADQLPSVGPGNVLRDIINSGKIEVVKLSHIFRQAQDSLIVVNAHRINQGEFPLFPKGDGLADFYFIEEGEPQRVLEVIKKLCKDRVPQRFNIDPVNDLQVLTPMHKGIVGSGNLNRELQTLLNPKGKELARGEKVFRVGDKVMQVVNNYEKEVFNGDLGRIEDIYGDQEVMVNYDGRWVSYHWNELDEILHAYAISVHKSQGSEYPAIILPLLTQHYVLLQRNLLYTALTRAKRLAILVGTKKAMAIAIKNNKVQKRYTLLKERLERE